MRKTDKHNRLLHEYITNEYGEKILLVAPKNVLFEHLRSQDTFKMNTSIKMPGENDDHADIQIYDNEQLQLNKINKQQINSYEKSNNETDPQLDEKANSYYPKSPLGSFNKQFSLFSYNYQESKNTITNRQMSTVMDFSPHETLAPSGTEFSESYQISEEIEEIIPLLKKSKLLSTKKIKNK
jgi:hypothetical protein